MLSEAKARSFCGTSPWLIQVRLHARSFLARGTRPPSRRHTCIRVVQGTDCLGRFPLSQPQLTGWKGTRLPHAMRGSECAEPPLLRWAETFRKDGHCTTVGLCLHPYSTEQNRNSARNAGTGFAMKSKAYRFLGKPIMEKIEISPCEQNLTAIPLWFRRWQRPGFV
jgi:hypothetical protein